MYSTLHTKIIVMFSMHVSAAIEKSARAAGMSTSVAEQYAQTLLSRTPASSVACMWQFFMLDFHVLLAGVKVSQNAPECRSRARKYKPGAFWLQNYWISQPEPTFLGPAS